MTKYFIKTRSDEFIIEVPSDWKITFAAVNPASNGMGGRDGGWCVRVYEMPGSKLRAVFDSAVSIRDMAIPLARKVRSEVGQTEWKRDSNGSFDRSESVDVSQTFLLEPEFDVSGNGNGTS